MSYKLYYFDLIEFRKSKFAQMQNQCNHKRRSYNISAFNCSKEIKILKTCVSNTGVKINNLESLTILDQN